VKRLIVNADDFGRSAGINAGVLEAHARGVVTSATVMVLENAAARGIRDAAERARGLSLGLHFALTGGGAPASAARGLPNIAPGGRFRRTREGLPDRLPPEEILLELEAQIGIFEVLARKPPSHLDSHHHVALHPSVAPVFAAVARQRSLPVRAASDEARRSLRGAGVRTPDRFVDEFYGESVVVGTLERILTALPDGTTELMCHPGHPDAELRQGSTYSDEREREIEVLCDPNIRALVRSREIELIGFDRL
jgi:chitin disaccharide deacetylase